MDENTKPAIDDIDGGLTEEERDKHMEESFTFGTERTFKVLDDALERDLDTWAVAFQMFHAAAFVLSQHGYSLDEMIADCKDAIKQSEAVNKDESVEEEIIDRLHEQGFKPTNEA